MAIGILDTGKKIRDTEKAKKFIRMAIGMMASGKMTKKRD
jgi:hypothetical protein